ncbi:MAG: hypothetical protein H0U74_04785 [Bradymonadaceae bacterium]|nr:hypothetical protein [Lujinxingiaceae bacterium]
MNPLSNPLEGFSAEFYLATLSEVAHSDGLHPIEEELLRQQATSFGVNFDELPQVPHDLSQIPWATRVLVYRDALMLAYADHDVLSPQEVEYLGQLVNRMQLPDNVVSEIGTWVISYEKLLDGMMSLLEEPT